MLEPDDLGPADEALLDLLQEGRVTAPFAADQADYNTQYIRDRLSRLVEHGHVCKVYQGLYELVEDPRDQEEERESLPDGGRGETLTPEAEETEIPYQFDIEKMEFNTDLTEVRREVLVEFLQWVADRGGPVKKGDFEEEFWNDDRADRSGYQERSFWELLAKSALTQSEQFEKPDARAYLWVGDE